ncbi:MAG: NADH-quinone oxidoreductase subunit I [Chloroherpetonaceae bacterium]|nr:NADH-quinone oxidoreductase subunit I [Chloroherpetonaceae bacterium]MCS7212091.1 NADH-quinone oxidoreductase subunit I [Chloroherpetonaceae bacterium]MDW8019049.1 NADH-quinone oxidoreductase subunit I [Chloroherpetonaceae bacterium]
MQTKNPPIKRTKLSLLERLYLPEILKGMAYTFRQMFRPKMTMSYPEVKWKPPAVFRGRPVLVEREDKTGERCVACGLCARVCPPLAISMQASETDLPQERRPITFEINMLRCIYCGYCEEVCPEEAIVMSDEYDITYHSRESAILTKEQLLVPMERVKARLEFLRQYKNAVRRAEDQVVGEEVQK